ncbi:MAG: phosphotransferase [Streptosporangiales bacterium]|nr:phosphotransferase [Streptosporangiales bacterium]
MAFEDALATWLVDQRWFAGKGRELRDLTVVADTQVTTGDPELRHLIVTVRNGETSDYYQVPVGLRASLPERLEHARIGSSGDGRQLYDALHDSELTRPLIEGIAAGRRIGGLALRSVDGAEFDTGLDSLVITNEQSNTSLVYGEESILKVFRRVWPGPNPDLEVTTALARAEAGHIAEPLGWIETRLDDAPTSLAILSRYLRLATDGWSLAATSVRDLYAVPHARAADAGGDFSGEARRLGEATAEIHAAMAEAFGTDEVGPDAIRELADGMFRKLDQAAAAVPELNKYAEAIGDAYSQLARFRGRIPVQRVHGDYHLGQVLRTPDSGWVVLDFEGEPAAPLAQRRARSSPLRDVAGMLRSFDYAARHQLIGRPDADSQAETARDWIRRNSGAFCSGYADAGGLDTRENAPLLRAFQLDKAVYEVLYEARHRPSWLPIPLDSLADL